MPFLPMPSTIGRPVINIIAAFPILNKTGNEAGVVVEEIDIVDQWFA